jgi:hypothetical protein
MQRRRFFSASRPPHTSHNYGAIKMTSQESIENKVARANDSSTWTGATSVKIETDFPRGPVEVPTQVVNMPAGGWWGGRMLLKEKPAK